MIVIDSFCQAKPLVTPLARQWAGENAMSQYSNGERDTECPGCKEEWCQYDQGELLCVDCVAMGLRYEPKYGLCTCGCTEARCREKECKGCKAKTEATFAAFRWQEYCRECVWAVEDGDASPYGAIYFPF